MSMHDLAKAVLVAAAASLLPLLAAGGFVLMESARAAGNSTVGLILDKLPDAGGDGYRALTEAAGNPKIQKLDMTHAEMWQVAPNRVDALEAAAKAHGVAIKRLDANWNRVLSPMAAEAAMTKEQSGMMKDAMSSKAAMGMQMMATPEPELMEYALTKGMHDAGAPGQELIFPLDSTTTIAARRTSVEKTDDGYIWHGTIVGTDDPVTLMWWPNGRLSGQITYRGHAYMVKHMGGEMHGVIEMEQKMLPPEHAPMGKALKQKMNMREDPLVTQGDASMLRQNSPSEEHKEPIENLKDASGASQTETKVTLLVPPGEATSGAEEVTITVLVAYTRAAASHYTDISKDLIALALADANLSFRNSGVGHVRLKLVHSYETDYVEKGTHFEHVFRFADKGDGFMDEVHALRDEKRADVALLIVDDANGCGLAAGVAPASDRAFAAVHHECASLKYSIAHEVGHIIGARHDAALDDSMHPFPYGHGFVAGKAWRSMMSYEESCDGCPRLPVWSNPRIKVRGGPAGDAMADNARVIAEQAARVAAFR